MLKILSYVEPCNIVADVGCDHGKIGAELLLHKVCDTCIFSDISEPSLNKAYSLIKENELLDKSKFVVCNGFGGYNNDIKIDTAIIAGMGGIEIANILAAKPKNLEIKKFVLQPNNNVVYLRRALVSYGYKINLDEIIIDDGIFYNCLQVELGEDVLSRDELEFGRTNLNKLSPEFLKYLEFKLRQLFVILENVMGTDKEEEIKNLIYQIKNVLKGKKNKCKQK